MATTNQATTARPPVTADGSGQAVDDRRIGELVSAMSEQTSRLVRDELRLAELDTRRRMKETGFGAGALGAAGGAALLAAGALVAAAVWGIHLWLAGWLACVVVAGALLLVAGAASSVGLRAIRKGGPPVPRSAVDSARADVEAVKEALQR